MDTTDAAPDAAISLDGTTRDARPASRIPTEAHNLPLIILTVIAVIFVLDWAQAVFIPLVFGIVISYALSPLVTGLQRAWVPRAVGAALLLLLIVGGLGTLAYSLRDDMASAIEALPETAHNLRHAIRKEWAPTTGTIENVQKAAIQFEDAATDSKAPAQHLPRGVMRVQIEEPRFNVRQFLWNGTVGALSLISLAVVVVFLAYFLLASGDTFRRKLVSLSGPTLSRKKITVQMLNDINVQIQRYLMVQVVTSAVVGTATWLTFLWLGLDNAAVWGVAAAVLNVVPYLGAIAITAGATLAGFIQFESLAMAFTVGGASLVINSVEGYLLSPWLTGRACRMNAVTIFAGILFWGWLWGAWGLLLGMPIMMAIKSVCDHVEEFRPVAELMSD